MIDDPHPDAWNNFVLHSDPPVHEVGSEKRSAAIAAQFMALANNGGINSFLTASYELDASEVVESLIAIGAVKAAKQLGQVLYHLRASLPRSSQEARWELLEKLWTEALDAHDVLSAEADRELMQVLTAHVKRHEAFYLHYRAPSDAAS